MLEIFMGMKNFLLCFYYYHYLRNPNFLLLKVPCFNLAVKFSATNLLNSGAVIYLLWSGVLFSTAVRAAVVAKLVILGTSILTSFILALRIVLVAKLVISGILSSLSLILAL